MNRKMWKKIITVICVAGILVLAFWYGGNAPGLQGFSVSDSGVAESRTESSQAGNSQTENALSGNGSNPQGKSSKNTGSGQSEDDMNFFEKIFMQIKQIGFSGTSKNTQNSKQAQKNANKAAEESSKTSSKKKTSTTKENSSKTDTASKTESQKNTTTQNDKDNSGSNTTEASSSDGEKNTASSSGNGENNDTGGSSTAGNDNSTQSNGTDADQITCTIFISCGTVLEHMDELSDAKKKIVPKDGVILKTTSVKVKKGATVFDVLQTAAKDNNIQLEYNYTPAYKNYYIEGIGNLYEFDAGNLSGWMYSVNGEFPGSGCSSYKVKDGDAIKWLYTCNFGKDVGDYFEE